MTLAPWPSTSGANKLYLMKIGSQRSGFMYNYFDFWENGINEFEGAGGLFQVKYKFVKGITYKGNS